jgi:hypothetical protein
MSTTIIISINELSQAEKDASSYALKLDIQLMKDGNKLADDTINCYKSMLVTHIKNWLDARKGML